jgi:uncharacterized membrane protein YhaH (DUF805 family)
MEQIRKLFLGRVNRTQWIIGTLAVSLPPTVFLATIAQLDSPNINSVFFLIAALLLIPAFALSVSLQVRRMHDINRGGLYVLLAFIPLVNLFYLYLLLHEGDASTNSYGDLTTQRHFISMVFNTGTKNAMENDTKFTGA